MSVTAATTVTKLPRVPPSTFSALLRRSKFASYDPKIGQIYTTYDGSAHRGDWGLKRPLTVRRRDGRLIIKSIDTMYQQTEWTSAYSDAITVRKFEEMGVTPYIEPEGTYWGPQFINGGERIPLPQLHDSDFIEKPSGAIDAETDRRTPFPNSRTMGPKRFERYLRKLRRLAPEFREFIENEKRHGSLIARKDIPYRALVIDEHPGNTFLSNKFMEACGKEDSTFIRPLPHPTAGLTYNNRPGHLQASIHAKPIPGRRLHILERKRASKQASVNVSLGGWIANEEFNAKSNATEKYQKHNDSSSFIPTLDLGTNGERPKLNLEAGSDVFRPMKVLLSKPPQVVGKYPQRLDEAILKIQAVSWAGAEKTRSNPHRPGTVEYIAYQKGRPAKRKNKIYDAVAYKSSGKRAFTMTNLNQRPKDASLQKGRVDMQMLKNLRGMLAKDLKSDEKRQGGSGQS